MTSIYLAGKIGKNDWRHDVISRFRSAWPSDCYSHDPKASWPVLKGAVLGAFDYAGPYFIGDDHGCGHGPGTHGCGKDGEICGLECGPSRPVVRDLCLAAIDRADVVFAWLDDPTAYGTLAELGYARGRGKDIVIAAPELPGTFEGLSGHGLEAPSGTTADLWFAFSLGRQIRADTPQEALRMLAEEKPQLDSPIEVAFWKAYLKHRPTELAGLKTQHSALGRYRLDFALPDKKIGIELDGYAWHSTREAFTKDRERQRNLELDGWRLIRFSGAEINANADRCVTQAAALIRKFDSDPAATTPVTRNVVRQRGGWPTATASAPGRRPGAWPTANSNGKGPTT